MYVSDRLTEQFAELLSRPLDYIQEYTGDTERPVRVLMGNGRQYDPDYVRLTWAEEQRDGYSEEECIERGLSILLYGCFDSIDFRDSRTPDQAWFAGAEDGLELWREVSRPISDCIYLLPARRRYVAVRDGTQGNAFAQADDRVLAYQYPLYLFMDRQIEVLDLNLFIGDAIEQALSMGSASFDNDEAREQFIAVASERSSVEIDRIRNEIAAQERQLTEYQEYVRDSMTHLQTRQELLDAALSVRNNVDEADLELEWGALQRHALIEHIRPLNERQFEIFTKMLDLSCPGYDHTVPVGKFAITIDFAANSLRVRNRTHARGGYDHPHVNNGDFCTGELSPTITRLMQQRQIAAAINMTIDALQVANPRDDWGRRATWWFEATDESGNETTAGIELT